jgi:hypothetical protein
LHFCDIFCFGSHQIDILCFFFSQPQSVKEAAEGKYDSSSNAQGRKITAIDGTVFTSFSKTGAWGKALYSGTSSLHTSGAF